MSLPKRKVHVFIVSDATGITAERVISAVLVQFKQIKPIFKRFPYIKTEEQVEDILGRAEKLEAIVIYSIVSQELRAWIQSEKRKRDVRTMPIRLAQARLIPRDSYTPTRLCKSPYKHAWPGLKTPRITDLTTGRTFEPFGPPDTLQMPGAGGLIREELLKLKQSTGVIRHAQDHLPKRQPVSTG